MRPLLELKQAILEVRAAIAIRRAEAEIKRFNPDQPRAPRGRSDGGQWVDVGGRSKVAMVAGSPRTSAGRSMTKTRFTARWWDFGVVTPRRRSDTATA